MERGTLPEQVPRQQTEQSGDTNGRPRRNGHVGPSGLSRQRTGVVGPLGVWAQSTGTMVPSPLPNRASKLANPESLSDVNTPISDTQQREARLGHRDLNPINQLDLMDLYRTRHLTSLETSKTSLKPSKTGSTRPRWFHC